MELHKHPGLVAAKTDSKEDAVYMFKTAAEVRSTFQAFATVAVVSNSLFWLIGGLWYWVSDSIDKIIVLSSAITIVTVLVYSLITLQLIFIPAVYLRKRFNSAIATILPPGLITLIIALLLYRNDINNPTSMIMISVLIFVPWYVANLAGLMVRFKKGADQR